MEKREDTPVDNRSIEDGSDEIGALDFGEDELLMRWEHRSREASTNPDRGEEENLSEI